MVKGPKDNYSRKAATQLAGGFPFPEPKVPVTWNFDQGTPAPELYPLDDLKEYIAKAVQEDGVLTMEYFGAAGFEEMTWGYAGLRQILADRMAKRDGRPYGKDGVMLVNGSAHGLSLIAQAYAGEGDGVVVENLGFPFMVDYLGRTGARLEPVPLDSDGMIVDEVPNALQRIVDAGLRPTMIYTIPSYQVPTGTCLTRARRERLVEIAQEWGVMLVEDICYHDLYFDQPPPPTLSSMDDTGLVIQSDSFSKILAPG
jgi:2-aminoadipate transaminase